LPNQAHTWSEAITEERDQVISSAAVSAASLIGPLTNSLTRTTSPTFTRQLKEPAAKTTLESYS
jgi:hypothetical protein